MSIFDDDLGDAYETIAGDSPYNAYTDRPSNLDLIGDCSGQRVLDLGCGAGHHTKALVDNGAYVDGIEGSRRLLEHATRRLTPHLGTHATLRQHDLETPLDFADTATYDGALLALVYHHITAREQLLNELFRVLRPGGWLVLSTTHPTADWELFGGSYYDQTKVTRTTGNAIGLTYWRQTLEQLVTELLTPGFVLERLVEPRPIPELRNLDPDRYARLIDAPCFLGLRLRRPAITAT